MKAAISTLALVLVFASPSWAQQLSLQINAGRVTLDATNVPAQQILSEWARIGGTTVVGAEKITGGPVTLRFADLPERQALDIILRNVAGFMAAPRQASATPGASAYDRILIMATSTAVPAQANALPNQPNGNAAANGTQRRMPPRPPNMAPAFGDEPPQDDQPMEDDQVDADAAGHPVFTFPSPGAVPPPGEQNPAFVPMQNNPFGMPANATTPVISLQPGANGPTMYNFVPTEAPQPGTTPPPGAFGVIGAPMPGMIQVPQPAPGQPVPGQPTPVPPTGTRPPGQ